MIHDNWRFRFLPNQHRDPKKVILRDENGQILGYYKAYVSYASRTQENDIVTLYPDRILSHHADVPRQKITIFLRGMGFEEEQVWH
jgi:hypothetical protein